MNRAITVQELSKMIGVRKPEDVLNLSQDVLDFLLARLNLTNDTLVLTDLEKLFAIFRHLGLATRIYFDDETGELAANGGQAVFTYMVPEGFVDVAEELGWDPTTRKMEFKWERDGKEIFKHSYTVRRERKVYIFDAEAWSYCSVVVTNLDPVNTNRMAVWGKCHFLFGDLYELIKDRILSAYPSYLIPEIEVFKAKLKIP